MDRQAVITRRLATQRLSSAPLATAAEVVGLFGCVQSQERDHAFFSLGMRARSDTYAAVAAEHDAGAFLRTHILRPTWHFVLPQDLRWILALTSPRVLSSMAARHRQLELDDERFRGRALEALGELLRGRNDLSRNEIGEQFAGTPGLPRAGEQLGHLLMIAELQGLVCSGRRRGVHHSYALVDEVVPPTPQRSVEEATAALALRFFTGHGPAGVKDFTRWSSLTVTATRAALADLGDQLVRVSVDGLDLWHAPGAPARRTRADPAYLFPTYDEVVLSYPVLGFPSVSDHPYAVRPDPFWAAVVCDQTNVGLWKRTVTGDQVVVETRLAPSLDASGRAAVAQAASRLARFLGKDLVHVSGAGTPPPLA